MVTKGNVKLQPTNYINKDNYSIMQYLMKNSIMKYLIMKDNITWYYIQKDDSHSIYDPTIITHIGGIAQHFVFMNHNSDVIYVMVLSISV